MIARAAALVLALAAAAGCLGPALPLAQDGAPEAADAKAALRASLADLPCAEDGTDASFRDLAFDALDDPGPTEFAEMSAHTYADGRTLLAVARIATGGFSLLDATDPAAPTRVGLFEPADEYATDLKFTADGTGVVVSGSKVIRIVDVRAPEAPRLEHTFDLADSGAHLIETFTVAGAEHVAASKGEGADLSIFRIAGEPGARSLERASTPKLTPLGDAPRSMLDPLRTHDAWFEIDPETDRPLLWIANVWWGIVALDVSDPAAPEIVASIPTTDPLQGYMHSAQVAHVDGRRLVVGTQEYGVGAVKVYDATDLANPRLVGVWTLDVPAKVLHNMQVVRDRLLVAAFHEGVYAFNLSHVGETPTTLAPVGWFPAMGDVPLVPAVSYAPYYGPRDVIVKDGVLWVTETTMGVRSVAYGCMAPGDAAATAV